MSNSIITIFIFLQETAGGIVNAPNQTAIEPLIIKLVLWLKLIVETTGAVIIAIGVVLAIYEFLKTLVSKQAQDYTRIRLLLARYLALALEFQLGADILSTAITPTLDQILTLGAIAVIRTGLNYFLSREMEQEKKIADAENKITENTKNSS